MIARRLCYSINWWLVVYIKTKLKLMKQKSGNWPNSVQKVTQFCFSSLSCIQSVKSIRAPILPLCSRWATVLVRACWPTRHLTTSTSTSFNTTHTTTTTTTCSCWARTTTTMSAIICRSLPRRTHLRWASVSIQTAARLTAIRIRPASTTIRTNLANRSAIEPDSLRHNSKNWSAASEKHITRTSSWGKNWLWGLDWQSPGFR